MLEVPHARGRGLEARRPHRGILELEELEAAQRGGVLVLAPPGHLGVPGLEPVRLLRDLRGQRRRAPGDGQRRHHRDPHRARAAEPRARRVAGVRDDLEVPAGTVALRRRRQEGEVPRHRELARPPRGDVRAVVERVEPHAAAPPPDHGVGVEADRDAGDRATHPRFRGGARRHRRRRARPVRAPRSPPPPTGMKRSTVPFVPSTDESPLPCALPA